MKILLAALVTVVLVPLAIVSQEKDWRRMERKKVADHVRDMQKKNGLNEIATDPKGFKLYAVVKENKIIDWQAKNLRGKRLKVTKHDYPAGVDESKEPGVYKMIAVCVEDKDVCYEVEKRRLSER